MGNYELPKAGKVLRAFLNKMYLRPYQDFNVGKKSEFESRNNFKESKARFYLQEDSCCSLAAE